VNAGPFGVSGALCPGVDWVYRSVGLTLCRSLAILNRKRRGRIYKKDRNTVRSRTRCKKRTAKPTEKSNLTMTAIWLVDGVGIGSTCPIGYANWRGCRRCGWFQWIMNNGVSAGQLRRDVQRDSKSSKSSVK